MIKHLFRPYILIALSAAVVVGAVVVVFRGPPGQGRPVPLPVAPGDREIVWLYTATNPTSWERFVAAVRRTAERLQRDYPGLEAQVSAAFPEQTTAIPEMALAAPGRPRLVFRWYKLTSDWKTRDWVEALLKRQPPPLAIIGGSSSDSARELASHLEQLAADMPEANRPLLLLTTATADFVAPLDDRPRGAGLPDEEDGASSGVPLTSLYRGRTFRFCFTNRQMAAAVTQFIWSRDELRPDMDPAYMIMWNDDSYSRDLIEGFWRALRQVVAVSLTNQWAWWASTVATGGTPAHFAAGILPIDRLPVKGDDPNTASSFFLSTPPTPQVIDSSVGSFGTPNRYEAKVARDLLESLKDPNKPNPNRPLLIVTGQTQPSRRFLHSLIQPLLGITPWMPSNWVVATGDAIAFNTVYRDRQVAWPIQDLPFNLVFFCHRNPVDREAGFRPREQSAPGHPSDPIGDATAATGTEDILLDADIVEALLAAADPSCASAAELAQRLAHVRLRDGRVGLAREGAPLFDATGQRRSGTGEHVVWVRTGVNDYHDRVLPEPVIEVWAWQRREAARPGAGRCWQRCGEPLPIGPGDGPRGGGDAHAGD